MSKPKKRLEPAPLARLRSLAQGDCTQEIWIKTWQLKHGNKYSLARFAMFDRQVFGLQPAVHRHVQQRKRSK